MKKSLVFILFVLLGSQMSAQEIDKGYEAYNDGDYATALKEWKPIAEQGYAISQYSLGLMYSNGYGVLKDKAEAVKWWRLSAEQGYAYAQGMLGIMYELGEGVLKDNITAHMWYNVASGNGHKSAGDWRDVVRVL